MLPTKDKLSIKRSLIYIGLSVVMCSLLPAVIFHRYHFFHYKKSKSPAYMITELVQTGPIKEALKSEHLEEILGLSVDQPQNLYAFDLKKAQENLYESGVIQKAEISLEEPNTLVVDYTLRTPVAHIADYTNLVIDKEGMTFPLSPYYTPKRLPEFYLGMSFNPSEYGQIQDEKFVIAYDILSFFKKIDVKKLTVLKIDVSKVRASSVGRQEVVVLLQEELGGKKMFRYLRLSPDQYLEGIEHYLSLKSMTLSQDLVIDLRLLPQAYLDPIEESQL